MVAFSAQMATDFEDAFADADEFGEVVTVTSPAGVATSNVQAQFTEYLGAQDEKTQGAWILPVATVPTVDRDWTITRTNGDKWQVTDVSQRDAACLNVRAALPQVTA